MADERKDELIDENLENIDNDEKQEKAEVENEEVIETTEENKKEEASDETSKLKYTIARLQADFQNYRNRTEKEKSSIYKNANEALITKLLPVVDNLERALATEKEHDSFYEGVAMIYGEINKILDTEGVSKFGSVGEKFDPNMHHAVFMEESDSVESEHIIETFQVGYKLKDKIIRPAMVKVAK